MPHTGTTLLLFLAYFLALAHASVDPLGAMLLPGAHLPAMRTRMLPSLLPRAGVNIRCTMMYSYDERIVPLPNSVARVSLSITGLPDGDHANAFKKAVEDECSAERLKGYQPRDNLGRTELVARMQVQENMAPPFSCWDFVIRKYTGVTDFIGCDEQGFGG